MTSDGGSAGRSLRCCFVLGNLAPDGAQLSTVALAEELPRHGVRPILVVLERHPDEVTDGARKQGVDVRVLHGRSRGQWLRELRSIVVRERIDVLVTAMPYADLIGRLAALITRRPVVSSFVDTFTYVDYPHGFFDAGTVLRRRDRLVAWGIRASGRYITDRWYATSPNVAHVNATALRLLDRQVVAIECGRGRPSPVLADPLAIERLRTELGMGAGVEMVLTLGRLHGVKGFDCLLDAWAIVSSDRHDLRLVLAGRDDGVEAELRQQAERLGVTDSVRFAGHRDDVSTMLQAASVFVQTSHTEGGPAAAGEAFAANTPVVMPRFQLQAGMLRDGVEALFVDPSDSHELAAAILACVDPSPDAIEATAARVVAAAGFFDEHLRIDGVAARMAALYRDTARNPHVPGKRRLR